MHLNFENKANTSFFQGNLVTNMNTTLAEATWNDSVWTSKSAFIFEKSHVRYFYFYCDYGFSVNLSVYPLGWIQKPTYANAPAVSFNCESI